VEDAKAVCDLSLAFNRISRAVRRTVALQAKVARERRRDGRDEAAEGRRADEAPSRAISATREIYLQFNLRTLRSCPIWRDRWGILRMRKLMIAATAAVALSFGLAAATAAWADDAPAKSDAKDKSSGEKGDKDKIELPPFPADASVKQVTHVAGKTLNYTATVGSLPVRDEKGKKIAEVVFTAYVLDGPRDPDRPVTFAFNGGPGAASVYLNLGAIGPKRVQFGAQGDSPSDSSRLVDNPGTWLDVTDMVFIDPVGTGFSRSLVDKDETKKRFYSIKPDIEYLSRIVYDWLLKNGRMASPKYISGESYGGFRAPKITYFL
jgi:carboxypeptidase C (cathepsin A)